MLTLQVSLEYGARIHTSKLWNSGRWSLVPLTHVSSEQQNVTLQNVSLVLYPRNDCKSVVVCC